MSTKDLTDVQIMDYDRFGERYFKGRRFDDGGHPAGYSDYRPTTIDFRGIADTVFEQIDESQTVFVVGCGYGYTIEILVDDYNVDARGLDISEFAISQSPVSSRIRQGDILTDNGIDEYDVVVSEYLLPCFDDESAIIACERMRCIATEIVMHFFPRTLNSDYYNVKLIEEWSEMCDPEDDDKWVSPE